MAVVDASFLLTMVPSDPKSRALTAAFPKLRRRFDLSAPDLLRWETGNAIHGKLRRHFGLDVQDRINLHKTLLRGIQLEPGTEEVAGQTALLAERFNLTFYDAAYLAQAAITDSVLWTEDRKLRAAGEQLLGSDRAWDVQSAISAAEPGWLGL